MSYVVKPLAADLEAVRTALDTANGLPVGARIFRGGIDVTGTSHDPQTRGVFCGTARICPPPRAVRTGGFAMLIVADARVDPYLGRVGIPTRGELVETVDLAP